MRNIAPVLRYRYWDKSEGDFTKVGNKKSTLTSFWQTPQETGSFFAGGTLLGTGLSLSFSKRRISFGKAPPSSGSVFGSGFGALGVELFGMPFIISLPGGRCPGGKPGCLNFFIEMATSKKSRF